MDFPIELSRGSMIDSVEELQSAIYHLVKNNLGDFLSSLDLGSHVELHSTEVDLVAAEIKRTFEEVPNLLVKNVLPQSETDYEVTMIYQSSTMKYNLDLTKYYGKQD